MKRLLLATLMLAPAAGICPAADLPPGPLRAHPDNPRYFTADGKRAILLTGSHTWPGVVDISPADPSEEFDFEAFAEWTSGYGHNFMRLWAWEPLVWDTRGNTTKNSERKKVHTVQPHPYARTGPGKAIDGKPKFDLTKHAPEYLRRVRSRAETAAGHGMYVSIMLFEGWTMQFPPDAWQYHPFNSRNNVNGIDGDANGDRKGFEVHTLRFPKIVELQQSYVRKVIDEVNDLDNVLFEIGNEMRPESTAWQYAMIEFIHDYEKTKPKQHPVGMTFQLAGGSNRIMLDSPADWISPKLERHERENPWPAAGRLATKVLLVDTDHIWGIGGTVSWMWKCVMQGMNPIFMDSYDGVVLGHPFDPRWEPVRKNMGYARKFVEKLDLASMTPRGGLSTSGYCLADPGRAYLIYAPDGTDIRLDLSHASGALAAEWLEPATGKVRSGESIEGGAKDHRVVAPFAGDAVLYLSKKD